VVTRIVEATEDDAVSAADLTELLARDHAISARILRLANSAFYGLRYPVDSIHRGVVVLGFDAVCHLALATSVFSSLAQRRQFALDPEDFWMHALGAARAAHAMAVRYGANESAEACFTAGLLHDIGKYLMALVLRGKYAAVADEARATGSSLEAVERERLEITHRDAGMWLAERWQLPPVTATVIAHANGAARYRGEYAREVSIAALASLMAREAGFGDGGDANPVSLKSHLSLVPEMTDADADRLLDDLRAQRADAARFLEGLSAEPARDCR
jgi:HD-like signal output (HDOD) protein